MSERIYNEMDGYLVEFETGKGWHCKCGDFERANICEHTVKSAAIHTIECVYPQVDLTRFH
jgi:hypothetical protein